MNRPLEVVFVLFGHISNLNRMHRARQWFVLFSRVNLALVFKGLALGVCLAASACPNSESWGEGRIGKLARV